MSNAASGVGQYDPQQAAKKQEAGIKLLPAAIKHVKTKLANAERAVGVRIQVKKTGCSGYQYEVQLVEQSQADDHVFLQDDGIQVFVEPNVMQKFFPMGVEVDYVRKGLNQQFEFRNPIAKNLCGCGESFQIEA